MHSKGKQCQAHGEWGGGRGEFQTAAEKTATDPRPGARFIGEICAFFSAAFYVPKESKLLEPFPLQTAHDQKYAEI